MLQGSQGDVTQRWPFCGQAELLVQLHAVASEPGLTGAVISGTPGSGKSRILDEFAAECGLAGVTVDRVVASRSAAVIPFGSFARLLPLQNSAQGDSLQCLQMAYESFVGRTRDLDGKYMLCVDDAHLLDEQSAALIYELSVAPIPVMVVVSDGQQCPDAVKAMFKERNIRRLHVAPLRKEAVEEILGAVLEGGIEPQTIDDLWRLTEGNPRFLREVVIGAVQEGSLKRTDGGWRAVSRLSSATNVVDLVEARLTGLNPEERSSLEVLSLGEPLDARMFAHFSTPDVEQSLHLAGWISFTKHEHGFDAKISHRLDSEVVEARLSPSHRSAIMRELVLVLRNARKLRPADIVRLAKWQAENGEIVDVAQVTAGARQALLKSPQTAERLARCAVEAGGGFEAQLVLAEAFIRLSDFSRADWALRVARSLASSEVETTRAAIVQIRNHAYGFLDTRTALATGSVLFEELQDAANKYRLAEELAWLSLRGGYAAEAVEWSDKVASHPPDRESDLREKLVKSESLRRLGRLRDANEVVDAGLTISAEMQHLPLVGDRLWWTRIESALYAGKIASAETMTRSHYKRARQHNIKPNVGMWAAHMGWALLFRGNITESLQMYDDARKTMKAVDPAGEMHLVAGWRAFALTQAGLAQTARSVVGTVGRDYLKSVFEAALAVGRTQAWLTALGGDHEAGARASVDVGMQAIDHSELLYGSLCIHDAVRLGSAHLVVEKLNDLATRLEGGLAPALAEHARAAASGDGEELDSVSDRFSEMGLNLLATEAAAQAANAHSDAGHGARSAVRSRVLAGQSPGASTPAMILRPRFLTAREFEIAKLAATGLTSRVIAHRLCISVRTVDNHLSVVYSRLHLGGRDELQFLLGARGREIVRRGRRLAPI